MFLFNLTQMRWAGYVARPGDNWPPKIIYYNNPVGQRIVVKPVLVWLCWNEHRIPKNKELKEDKHICRKVISISRVLRVNSYLVLTHKMQAMYISTVILCFFSNTRDSRIIQYSSVPLSYSCWLKKMFTIFLAVARWTLCCRNDK